MGRLGECVTDVDHAPDGQLYAVDDHSLYQVDVGTANLAEVGRYRSSFQAIASQPLGIWNVHPGYGEVTSNVDFANVTTGGIEGRVLFQGEQEPMGMDSVQVYMDLNDNEAFDVGEPLTQTTEDDPDTADVDETGRFAFDDVLPGQYVVRIAPPDGFDQLLPADSSGHPAEVGSGGLVEGLTFTNVVGGSVHGQVFDDANGDGHRSVDEHGIEGVTVYLDLDQDGVLDEGEPQTISSTDDPATADIDESGEYSLGPLSQGSYFVRQIVPDDRVQTLPLEGEARPVEVRHDAPPNVIDLGNTPGATLHGTVFEDRDGDGRRGVFERGLSGVTVFLDLDRDGTRDFNEPTRRTTLDDRTTSDVDEAGSFSFSPVAHGSYEVRQLVPSGFEQTNPPELGGLEMTVGVGELVMTGTFANHPLPGRVGGVIWDDVDGDGRKDGGETGISGRTVFLDFNSNGSLDPGEPKTESIGDFEATLDVDESGLYLFDNLQPGTYTVAEVMPEGWRQTNQFSSGSQAAVIDVRPSAVVRDINFGNQRPPRGEIRGVVWDDLDEDGTRDESELGLPGWNVFLDINTNGRFDLGEPSTETLDDISATPTVDETGMYAFEDLDPGTYSVFLSSPDGWQQTFPLGFQSPATAGRLFALRIDGTRGVIQEVDTATGATINQFSTPTPIRNVGEQGLALGGGSLFYIDGSVSVGPVLWELDPDSGEVVDSDVIISDIDSQISAASYLSGKVYLLDSANSEIAIWDPVSDSVESTIPVSGDIVGSLTGAGDLGVLFAGNQDGQIVRIDPADGTILDTLSSSGDPAHGGLAYLNGELVVVGYGTNSAARRVDPDNGNVIGEVALPGIGSATALGGDAQAVGTHTVRIVGGSSAVDVNFGNVLRPESLSAIPGDTDLNGAVDFSDFLVVSGNFGLQESATARDGDFDGNGSVEFSDFLILANNFGESRQGVPVQTTSATAQATETRQTDVSARDDLFERFDDDLALAMLL